jgi:hypothetical protein
MVPTNREDLMKWLIPFLFLLVICGCGSSQYVTYTPAGSNDPAWQVQVVQSRTGQNFRVIINDSTVIGESANFLNGILVEHGTYKGKEIKLTVTYSSGFLGIGAGYEALVFINNERAGKFTF